MGGKQVVSHHFPKGKRAEKTGDFSVDLGGQIRGKWSVFGTKFLYLRRREMPKRYIYAGKGSAAFPTPRSTARPSSRRKPSLV